MLSFFSEQDILEYKKKQRPQKIKMLDGAVKTIMVDDSKTVGELLVTICSRIGTVICHLWVQKSETTLPRRKKSVSQILKHLLTLVILI